MADLQHTVGAVIREARHEREMTLKDLAERSAISVVYLGEIERGKKYPSPIVLERLAESLDLTVSDLLDRVSDALRSVAEPQMAASAIGFRLPERSAQSRPQVTITRIVDLLEPDTQQIGARTLTLLRKVTDAVA